MKTRIHIQSFGRQVLDITVPHMADADALELETAINSSRVLRAHISTVEDDFTSEDSAESITDWMARVNPDGYTAIRVKGSDHYTGDDEFTVHVLTLDEARALRNQLSEVIAQCKVAESLREESTRPWFPGQTEPPPFYRKLREGEIAQEHDLIFSDASGQWHLLASGFGLPISQSGAPMARRDDR